MSTDYIPDGDSQLTSIYEREMARRDEEVDEDAEADDPCGLEDWED